jgi:sensor c-di-GMP phosphodiesterase-like protein
MNSRIRTLVFALLLIGVSSILLFQSFQTSVASTGGGLVTAAFSAENLMPLQNANSTSTQPVTSNSTTQSTNVTITNSTASQSMTFSSQSSSSTENQTMAISYLQYQMTSMNDELVAMSSSVSAINQQAGMNTLIAEAGLIVGILAIIAAIAIARRADALYGRTAQAPSAGSAPPK